MKISILTLFPDMLRGPFDQSIVKRAIQKNLIEISYINIRDFATDRYKTVDGRPYGGGTGMILRVDVVDRALQYALSGIRGNDNKTKVILLDPAGTAYKQSKAKEFSTLNNLILICGHYEGIDDRIRSLVDEEISIGDYVLTGGEIPAMVLVDSIVRLVPKVLSKSEATVHESFSTRSLEYPQYTEPRQYQGMAVPEVLLSGNHANIATWRAREQEIRTGSRRKDLITA